MRGFKFLSRLMLIALLGMTAACGTQQESVSKPADKPAIKAEETQASTDYPRTIKHLNGETVIPARPVKIATPYIAFVDYLAVLDEYPIAAQGIEIIKRNFPNLSKHIEGKTIMDLGMEVDMEKLLAAGPDVIIAADDMKDQYDRLSQIAPTVIFPQAGDWRETLQQIAEVIGKEDYAKNVLADFDAKSEAYKQKLAFRQDESVMFAMYSGKEQFITWRDGRFDPFYVGLGLKRVEEAQQDGPLSLESLVALNPDHLFIINNWQFPVEGGVMKALADNKVWNGLKAVANYHVYELKDPSLPGPMALAKIDGIEEIMKALGK
ncbi:ABC transporter substrate-binding protein [Paenibacillus guangzhouensis]|uniref:ABC transporter substrate-binding protein n=1 Tax=Paenibacillus guangzhouensis TaxID=1473112 RepID=UPI0012676CA3|nr:ABC transporter substrate-binding protein [Paenibacillus guangzhouensis]